MIDITRWITLKAASHVESRNPVRSPANMQSCCFAAPALYSYFFSRF
jgi:hypothetical protein